jgi:hypothetical protein
MYAPLQMAADTQKIMIVRMCVSHLSSLIGRTVTIEAEPGQYVTAARGKVARQTIGS